VLAAAVARHFLLEECIEGPFQFAEKLVGKKQPNFIRVRKRIVFVEELLRFAFSHPLRWPFVMQNVTDPEFPFRENGGIERNFVPISEGIPRFDTETAVLPGAAKAFDGVFNRHPEARRQAKLNFLGQHVIRAIEAESVSLINDTGVSRPGWKDVGVEKG